MHQVLKKYRNSKWTRNLKYLSRILLKAKQFIIYAKCKIEFHDQEFQKISNGIELFNLSIEKVWKMIHS